MAGMSVTQPVGHFPELGTLLLWEWTVAFRVASGRDCRSLMPSRRTGHSSGFCSGGEMSPGPGGQCTWLISVRTGMWDGMFIPWSRVSGEDVG